MVDNKGVAMSLNENAAKAWFDSISNKEIIPAQCHDEDFANNYLDSRDIPPFDDEWIRSFEFITKKINGYDACCIENIKKMQGYYGRFFFDKVIRKFHDSELAADVSEDMELIAAFMLTGESNDFIKNLMSSYEKCELPTG